jgi:hypothetical protein
VGWLESPDLAATERLVGRWPQSTWRA